MASQIDYDTFLKWATDHFGVENIRIHGSEICTHSVFAEDHKFHLWMNPSGGKSELEGGAYRCWYTDRCGSLISLVSIIEKIPYEEAEELISGPTSLRALEKKLDEFFGPQEAYGSVTEVKTPVLGLQLPDSTYKIDELPVTNFYRQRAESYLSSRKLPTDGLYVCIDGDYLKGYKNRIIIPYYDKTGNLVYYNARTMSKNKNALRYRKPEGGGFVQDNVLYCYKWPRKNNVIYLTEGEFDARTLDVLGYNGVACGGKSLSDAQVELIREYIPVLAFDNDEGKKQNTGEKALINIGTALLEKGFPVVYFIRPPKGFKDWNELMVKVNPDLIRQYINKHQKRFDIWTANKLMFDQL